MDMIKNALINGRDISLVADHEDLPEENGFLNLMKALSSKLEAMRNPIRQEDAITADGPLPNVIHFPYARHSSLPELRELVGAFRPKDVVPCTFDVNLWSRKDWSIQKLFGDYCSTSVEQRWDSEHTTESASQESEAPTPVAESSPMLGPTVLPSDAPIEGQKKTQQDAGHEPRSVSSNSEMDKSRKRDYYSFREDAYLDGDPNLMGDSQNSDISDGTYKNRRRAFDIAAANIKGESWEVIGLLSTTDHHTIPDQELGQP